MSSMEDTKSVHEEKRPAAKIAAGLFAQLVAWGAAGCIGWFADEEKTATFLKKRALPKGMPAGGHGGSHSYLTDDFIHGILDPKHRVCVDVVTALNTTIAGVYAHMSAMKGGESLKIPEITL